MSLPIRVVVIDDHPLTVQFIVNTLKDLTDMEIVGTENHGRHLMSLVRKTRPDVVILDLHMSDKGFDPIHSVQNLKKDFPNVQIIVLTADETPFYKRKFVEIGALGYVLKSDDLSLNIPEGIRTVYRGKPFYSSSVIETVIFDQFQKQDLFTEQELSILRLLKQGLTLKRIGEELTISYGRARNILSGMYAKAGVNEEEELTQRDALLRKAEEWGLL